MASPMNGYEVLTKYVDFIEQIVEKGLEEWSSMRREPIELLDEIGSLFFKVILHIFLGIDEINGHTMAELHTLYKELGLLIMSIFPYDLPGFTYHQALKNYRVGVGSRFCGGSEIAKFEITNDEVLNYK
ncbi:ent-kaurenoic acid oxidase 2-like [Benincasa hispida]|uniref:ent-kaurenoic acid oxidase 2-like n=1 Tax=Benincasa hispida TaxID=102211 RepID=UPI0018FFFDF2|nr:ent-kaurenoic acid oxidase 2-like [Benincasa hispida]